MGHIYLINRLDTNEYKIGITKNGVNKRLKQLQTGNGGVLEIVKNYDTLTPYNLENMLHFHYRDKKTEINNEWFILSDDDVKTFIDICNQKQSIIDIFKDSEIYKTR